MTNEWMVLCPECEQAYPRAEFKRRGGGRNRMCRQCNRNRLASTRSERYYTESVVDIVESCDNMFARYVITEAMVEDYNDESELNRKRIKEMESSNSQTNPSAQVTASALGERAYSQEQLYENLIAQITAPVLVYGTTLEVLIKRRGFTSGTSDE